MNATARPIGDIFAAHRMALLWCCAVLSGGAPSLACCDRTDVTISTVVARPAGVARASIAFHLVADSQGATTRELVDAKGAPLHVEPQPFITARDVSRVEVVLDVDLVHYAITLHFSPSAAQRMKSATSATPSPRVALLIDGKLLMVMRVMVPLDTAAMITNSWSHAEALGLAQRLAP